jgi:hypothetical protein
MDEDPLYRLVKKYVPCPHCGASVRVCLQVEARLEVDLGAPKTTWKDALPEKSRHYLEAASSSGMLSAFEQCCKHIRSSPPSDVERFFLTVLKTCRPKTIPKHALDAFKAAFPGHIEYYSAQGVGIVVAEGVIRLFVPVHLTVGESIRTLAGTNMRVRADANLGELLDWMKTRWGYVPAQCKLFMTTLRRASLGEFENPVLQSGDK